MTLSNIQLLAVRGAGGWLGRVAAAPWGSVGQHSIETTEINRGGEWAGVPPTGPVPAHLPRPPKPCSPGSPMPRH